MNKKEVRSMSNSDSVPLPIYFQIKKYNVGRKRLVPPSILILHERVVWPSF